MLICGIDIGKKKHEASVIDEQGKLLSKSLRFDNSVEGVVELERYLEQMNPDRKELVFGMEATGHYWLNLYSFLSDKGFTVHVVNPIQTDALRNLFIRKTKNDSKDSFLVAEMIRIGRYCESNTPKDEMLALRQLCRHRMELVDFVSDQKRRIIGLLDRIFPEYEKLFSDIFGKSSVELLSKYTLPEEIAEVSTKKLTELLRKNSQGRLR
jgi:transposase